MTKKSIKRDLKAFGSIWFGLILLTVVIVLLFFGYSNSEGNLAWAIPGALCSILLCLTALGSIVFSTISVGMDFYRSLSEQEAQLPEAKPRQSLFSHFLFAMIFNGGTVFLSLGCLIAAASSIIFSAGLSITTVDRILRLLDVPSFFSRDMALYILSLLVGIASGISAIHFGCCLGHLCRKNRGLLSVLITVSLFLMIGICSFLLRFCLSLLMVHFDLPTHYTGCAILANTGLCVLCYLLCNRILRKKEKSA